MFTVKVDVPDPVTVGGLKGPEGQVIPVGMVPQARVTTPLNPLTLETVTVRVALVEPTFTVAGETPTEKSCTVKLAPVPRGGAVPKVPETVTLKFPLAVGFTVSWDVPGQLTGLGLKLVPPRVELNWTGPLKPVLVEHVTVYVAV